MPKGVYPRKLKPISDRFWSKVDKTTGYGPNGDCWEWKGAKNETGYGIFGIEKKRLIKSHRFSFQLYNGDIPKSDDYHGICVLHKCDNPGCVNPAHLFLGTQIDNIKDMTSKGRRKHAVGEKASSAKLTEAKVRAIRADKRGYRKLAKEYGVARQTIAGIKKFVYWKHLDK